MNVAAASLTRRQRRLSGHKALFVLDVQYGSLVDMLLVRIVTFRCADER